MSGLVKLEAVKRGDDGLNINSGKRHLRSGETNAEHESDERAMDVKMIWKWKFSTEKSLYKMLRDKQFRYRMFKTWDDFRIDRLWQQVDKLQDHRLNEMFWMYTLGRTSKYEKVPSSISLLEGVPPFNSQAVLEKLPSLKNSDRVPSFNSEKFYERRKLKRQTSVGQNV
ncbi:hypothetical protein PHMEG_00029492 [Phytophthora megakarya]|uniref:RxLR effector protein n=1 Tax=Phytophthora megakarya TaxID=4795 RepID=A0A225V2K4_9STRA|nr:hypothetical protein PHMEG_00029492 [Phytophthora megakarya]